MNKFVGKKLAFVFLAYALIMQSFITNAGQGQVVAKVNSTNKFHNDAEKLLTKAVRYLIGVYAFDDTTCVIREIHRHPSSRFNELRKTFDTKIPVTDPTCSHKTVELLDSGHCNGFQSLQLTDLDTRTGVPLLSDVVAISGPLAHCTKVVLVKKFPHYRDRLQLLFPYTCKRSESGGCTVSSGNNIGVFVEAEADSARLQIAGFSPLQQQYCPILECWQLANCRQHNSKSQ